MPIQRNRTLKKELENLHINFSNCDFSLNFASISAKFLGNVPHSDTKGSVSQNVDKGPTCFFMLCRNLRKSIFSLLFMFHIIKK